MAFDPTQPFEAVQDFDASKPFERIQDFDASAPFERMGSPGFGDLHVAENRGETPSLTPRVISPEEAASVPRRQLGGVQPVNTGQIGPTPSQVESAFNANPQDIPEAMAQPVGGAIPEHLKEGLSRDLGLQAHSFSGGLISADFAQGLAESAIEAEETMRTVPGLLVSTAFMAGGAPAKIAKAIMAVFMAKEYGRTLGEFSVASQQGDAREMGRAAGMNILTGLGSFGIAPGVPAELKGINWAGVADQLKTKERFLAPIAPETRRGVFEAQQQVGLTELPEGVVPRIQTPREPGTMVTAPGEIIEAPPQPESDRVAAAILPGAAAELAKMESGVKPETNLAPSPTVVERVTGIPVEPKTAVQESSAPIAEAEGRTLKRRSPIEKLRKLRREVAEEERAKAQEVIAKLPETQTFKEGDLVEVGERPMHREGVVAAPGPRGGYFIKTNLGEIFYERNNVRPREKQPEPPAVKESLTGGKGEETKPVPAAATGSETGGVEETKKPLSPAKELQAKVYEFNDLVAEHGEQQGWGIDLPSSETQKAQRKQKGYDPSKIPAAKRLNEAIRKALFDIDERDAANNITKEAKARLLPKLKEFLAKKAREADEATAKLDAEADRTDTPDEVMGVPSENDPFNGPGAAKLGTVPIGSNPDTGISERAMTEQRAERGEEPLQRGEPQRWEDARVKAMAMSEQELDAIESRLERDPRGMDLLDEAAMTRRLTQQRLELHEAARNLSDAKDYGHPTEALFQKVQEIKTRIRRTEAIVGIGGAASELGRGLGGLNMMMAQDFTFAAQEHLLSEAKGRPLYENEIIELTKQIAAHEKLLEQEKAARAQAEAEAAAEHVKNVQKEVQAAVERTVKEQQANLPSKQVLDIARKWVAEWRAKADESAKRLFGSTHIPITKEALTDLAKIARADLAEAALTAAEWTAKMVERFGEKFDQFKPHAQAAWERAHQMMEDQGKQIPNSTVREQVKRVIKKSAPVEERTADTIERIKAKVQANKLDEINPYVQKLVRIAVEKGARGWREVTDAVHAQLKEIVPDLDYRDTLDAITNHGKLHTPAQDEISIAVRDAKAQGNEVRKIQEVVARLQVQASGFKRDAASTAKRQLTKIYEAMKRRFGVTVTDPATQLRSALQARETYYEHRIEDLQHEIAVGKLTVRTKSPSPTSAKLEALQAELERVKAEHVTIFKKPGLTDAQKLAMAESAAERNEAYWEKRLANAKKGIFDDPNVKGSKLESVKLNEIRAWTQAVKEQFQELKDLANPKKTPEEIALQSWITRNTNRLAELQAKNADLESKLAAGAITKADIAPKARKAPLDTSTNPKLNAIQVAIKKSERQMLVNRFKAEEALRPKWLKWADQIAGTAKASALSGYHTLLKLAGFSVARAGEIPTTEFVNAGLSITPGFRGLSERAYMESGNPIRATVDFFTGAATRGLRAARQALRTGTTESGILYGKKDYAPPKWFDFFGANLHQAEKAPIFTGAEEMYRRKAFENAIKQGLDPSNEFVRAQINKEAYDYAKKSILQENNLFSQAVNALSDRMEKANPKTGQIDITNALISKLVKTLITKDIIRIPANYIAQTIARTPLGLTVGVVKTGMANYRGIGNLSPIEANAIKGLVGTGAIGTAFFVLGMIDATKEENDRTFGGYWEPGRKRGGDDVEWGKIRLGGITLPHLLTHNPLTESAQMGSTMMRVAISRFHRQDKESKGMLEGAIQALVGLAGKAPVAGPIMQLDRRGASPTGHILKGLVPQLIQNIAEDIDPEPRSPKTLSEDLKSAVPWLRSDVSLRK